MHKNPYNGQICNVVFDDENHITTVQNPDGTILTQEYESSGKIKEISGTAQMQLRRNILKFKTCY